MALLGTDEHVADVGTAVTRAVIIAQMGERRHAFGHGATAFPPIAMSLRRLVTAQGLDTSRAVVHNRVRQAGGTRMGNEVSPQQPPSARSFRRRAYLVFLLSSVIPLGFLAVLADIYVIPSLSPTMAGALTTALVLVGVLAILSFLLLTQVTAEALGEIHGSNRRLRLLVDAARSLSDSRFGDVIAEETVRSAAAVTGADIGFVFRECPPESGTRSLPASCGEHAPRLLAARREALISLFESVTGERTPAHGVRTRSAASPDEQPGLLGPIDDQLATGSFLAAPLATQGQSFGMLLLLREARRTAFTKNDLDLATMLAQHAGIALHNACLQEAEKNFFTHVTEMLVQALDLHVDHHAGHSKGVAHFSSVIAHEMGLEAERTQRLFFAALLHDVGMLRLDDEAMADETHLRSHPELGAAMIEPITLWSDLAPLILHHHERIDGRGYPKGLSGEEIPLESRIIAVADAYDTMTRASSYTSTHTPAEALREMREHAGTQLDPAVVEALAAVVARESNSEA